MTNKQINNQIILGCVADDFTGASDAASFLAKQGIKTILFNGVPKHEEDLQGCAAVVIALKSRSVPANEAVDSTLQAFKWLEKHHTKHFYFKYCSTFDSTPKGNIGPVADSVLEHWNLNYTLLCPALPINKRIVKDGVLIVDDKPIAEGHMANHPLNPIWESRIDLLMNPQSKYPCMVIDDELLHQSKETIIAKVNEFGKDKQHFYIIPDYKNEVDGQKIAEVFGDIRFITGGSGILAHLADKIKANYDCETGLSYPSYTSGKALALSGSCSRATCKQCNIYAQNHITKALYPSELLSGKVTVDSLNQFIQEHQNEEILLYSAGATDSNSRIYDSKETERKASKILETTMATLAKKAYDNGYTRIIVAGGETSGAVMLALNFDAFIIGESIDPGVPIMIPLRNTNIRLALKSGNFGADDFFAKAFKMTKEC